MFYTTFLKLYISIACNNFSAIKSLIAMLHTNHYYALLDKL